VNLRQQLTAFLCLLCFALTAQQKPRYALVIGNASYGQGPLRNPVNDAMLIQQKLEACGFRVQLEKNLSKKQFDEAVTQFYDSIKKKNCEALFYYSGHGIQYQGENYLIPVDATLNAQADIEYQCVPLGTILGRMNSSASSANIIIMDACRNNPFSRSWMRSGDLDKGLKAVSTAPKESFIFYATAQNEVALDGSGSNSPFTLAFANHVIEPGLSINELLIKIINDVNAQYPKQRPWGSMSIKKDFYFMQPGKNNGQQRSVSAPIETRERASLTFVANEDCSLFINGENVSDLKAREFKTIERRPGTYAVRVVSKYDTTVAIDSVFDYPAVDSYHDYFDLQKIIDNKKQMLESDPSFIARKKMFDKIKGEMVEMKGGEFMIGNNSGKNDEFPQHRVKLNNFLIGSLEVSQEEWRAVMGTSPSNFANCNDCPVEDISWDDAVAFIEKLNSLSGENYRLPTEAEWEYAARGGNLSSRAYGYSGSSKPDKIGWTSLNSEKKTHSRAGLSANEKGIYDMTGNVAEWCRDWYDPKYYSKEIFDNPQGPEGGKTKVVRGGSWNDDEMNCRNSSRHDKAKDYKSSSIGFRLAKDSN